jgi:hypothetical protein
LHNLTVKKDGLRLKKRWKQGFFSIRSQDDMDSIMKTAGENNSATSGEKHPAVYLTDLPGGVQYKIRCVFMSEGPG